MREVADKLDAIRPSQRRGVKHGNGVTVGEYLASWLDRVSEHKKPKTARHYEYVVRCHLHPALGAVKLDKLTADHVDKLMRGKDLSPRTRHHIRAVLRNALNDAVAVVEDLDTDIPMPVPYLPPGAIAGPRERH